MSCTVHKVSSIAIARVRNSVGAKAMASTAHAVAGTARIGVSQLTTGGSCGSARTSVSTPPQIRMPAVIARPGIKLPAARKTQ
ncbi:hypothetical protein ACWGID_12620 [Kribbella sp. NPDC054772]